VAEDQINYLNWRDNVMEIQIRHAEPSDLEAIHQIYTQPKVVWGTHQLPYSPLEKHRQRLSQPQDGSFTLVACVDGEVVGHLKLRTFPDSPRRKHVGSIGMGVHDKWQGKGVGTALMEAATVFAEKWLNLSRLALSVYVDNEAGIRLYKKFGFEIEGRMQQDSFRDGQFVDVYLMGRVKDQQSAVKPEGEK
jgi:putative acetyltransferase